VKGIASALPNRTLSITIVRAGVVHGYVGCVSSSFKFSIDNGVLIFGASIIGRSEATQSSPTASWPTTAPYGPGMYSIEIPTASPVTDTDTFEWTCEDNGEAQFRLKSTGRGSDYIKFGERDITCTMGRDFTTRTDLDAFKAATAQSITLTATKGANNSITLLTPVTVKESYEVALSSQGDLVRADVSYRGMINGSGDAYNIVVKTQEDIT
jgi:hypothetical protein